MEIRRQPKDPDEIILARTREWERAIQMAVPEFEPQTVKQFARRIVGEEFRAKFSRTEENLNPIFDEIYQERKSLRFKGNANRDL